jgi:hypothetical protein
MDITNAKNKLLQEIKINKPLSLFKVTNKGKEVVKSFNDWWVNTGELGWILGIDDLHHLIFETNVFNIYPKIENVHQFHMLLENYGESIIYQNNTNDIEQTIQRGFEIIGYDREEMIILLKNFEKEEWITKISI